MDILDMLAPLTALGLGPIAIAAGVFTRISTMVFFLPGLGEKAVATRIRLGAAFAIALVLTPIVLAQKPVAPETVSGLVMTIAAEAVAGALIGFAIRIGIFVIETAGAIASQSQSLSQLFTGGLNATPETPIASLFVFAAIAVALSTGLHFKAVAALAYSYDVMPFGVFPGAGDAGQWAADRTAFAFSAALALALPFVMLGFIYNLAIGAANRAMPQLMVAFVGAPAVTLAGLVLLALTTPLLLGSWMSLVDGILRDLLGLAQ